MFRRSIVVADEFAPSEGAFPYALEFAARLALPLSILSLSAGLRRRSKVHAPPTQTKGANGFGREESRLHDACIGACGRAHVACEWSSVQQDSCAALRQAVRSEDLFVFHEPGTVTEQALRGVWPQPTTLTCPKDWAPTKRALVVNDGAEPDGVFLSWAAALCRGLDVEPIVLTRGSSERLVSARDHRARGALAEQGLGATFDWLVGGNVQAGIGHVARWRHCQLVIVRQEPVPAWWRRLGRAWPPMPSLDGHYALLSLACAAGRSASVMKLART